MASGPARRSPIPDPVATRLSLYLRQLETLDRRGLKTISSSQLAESLRLTSALVRSDLSYLNFSSTSRTRKIGHSGMGYRIDELTALLRCTLGTDRLWEVVLVGAGNLGRALLAYGGFATRGFRLVAVFDCDPKKVATSYGELSVRPVTDLVPFIHEHSISLAIIAVPATDAQDVADTLTAAGIDGLLNFAPVSLRVPDHVALRDVDISVPLEQIAFDVTRRRQITHLS